MSSLITKNVPKLRFPEFTDEWRVKRLGDLLDTVVDNRGKTPPVITKGIPLIETNALGNKQVRYDVIKKFVTEDTFNTWFRKHLENNDVLFSTVGQTGVTALYNDGTVAGIAQNIVGLRANQQTTGDLLYYLLSEKRNNHKFKQIEMIAVQPSVKVSQMIHLNFKLPSKPEQQKIAEFLTAVDERVELLSKKVELLKKYKKGMLQKIFTQQIRFKDENGKYFANPEELAIEDIAYSETSPLSANQIEGKRGAYKVYGASGVLQTLDTYHYKDEYIAIVKDGAGVGRISFCEAKSSVLGTMIVVQPKEGTDKKFLYYLLSLVDFKKYTTGSTIPHVYFKQYSKEKFFVPELKEQQKIASFLSSLDDKIKAEEAKLKAAKEWKKGLLQRMFV